MPGFHVADVHVARAELEEHGVELLGPVRCLRDYPGFEDAADCAWFTFRAPDGNANSVSSGSRPRGP